MIVLAIYLGVLAAIFAAVALAALYALAKFSIAAGRFDIDLTSKAFNLRRAIDEAVEARIATVSLVGPAKRAPRAGAQPPDPNVRVGRIVDDVAEMEREMNRVMSPDAEYSKRDGTFRERAEALEL